MSAGGRGLHLGLAAAITVAAVGLVAGVERGAPAANRRSAVAAPPAPPAVGARSYRDLRERSFGVNADLAPRWWAGLARPTDLLATVVQTPADRDAALVARAARRAYDGAPPTIPHQVDQLATPVCLTCHELGATVGGKTAPAMSHTRRDSCLQCHVVMADPRPVATPAPAPIDNRFVGQAAPAGGARAWDGAPPVIPHRTFMRERCESCHGLTGATGMRSTHPWRQSCQQCHAGSAELDQRRPSR